MTDPLTAALIAAGSSLLTILLTPKLQYYFWKYQRRADLRLSVINDANQLTAQFIANYTATHHPSQAFLARLISVTAQVKSLFSDQSYQLFRAVDLLISQNLTGGTVAGFFQARDAALRALYEEVGVL